MTEARTFTSGTIEDVQWRPLEKFHDDRGWLAELWRTDKVDEALRPVMTYISETKPGVVRGPHEHEAQTDYFCFLGPGNFRIYLWDNRANSPTYNVYQTLVVGQKTPMAVAIPEGVVHAYKNISDVPGIVINAPNALYRGKHYAEDVDEIRHEDDPESPFHVH